MTGAPDRRGIRWNASWPKSGNTLVRLFQIAYEDPDAFHLNHRPAHHVQDTDPAWYERVAPCPVAELSEDEGFHLRNAVFVHMIHALGTPYVKTHAARASLHWMPLIPPPLTDRAIYVIRDPRAVAVSMADHLRDGTIDRAIEVMGSESSAFNRGTMVKQLSSTWSLHVRSWLHDKIPFPRYAVRFEDMLADPEKSFRMMIGFLEWTLDPGRLRAALDLTRFETLQADEQKHGFISKPEHQKQFFRVGKADAWKDVLSPGQVARIEQDHREVMTMCRYEISTVEAA